MMRPENRQDSTRSHPASVALAAAIGAETTPALAFGIGGGLECGFDPNEPHASLVTAVEDLIPNAAAGFGLTAIREDGAAEGTLLVQRPGGSTERAIRSNYSEISLADGRSIERSTGVIVWVISGASRPITEDHIATALATAARRMDAPATPTLGLDGLAALVDFIPTLDTSNEAQSIAAKLSSGILLHSGGGAAWRRFYRDFLNEASAILPAIAKEQLGISMTRVGDTWQTFGEELARQATSEEPSWTQAAKYALAVQTFEETFWERVKVVFS